jgi:hypothetical protein
MDHSSMDGLRDRIDSRLMFLPGYAQRAPDDQNCDGNVYFPHRPPLGVCPYGNSECFSEPDNDLDTGLTRNDCARQFDRVEER